MPPSADPPTSPLTGTSKTAVPDAQPSDVAEGTPRPVPAPVRRTRRDLVVETALVLGVSLGASAVWALLQLVDKLTRHVALSSQTTSMNTSVTPDRPWLDLAYQLTGVVLGVVPALLAVHLLRRDGVWRPGGSGGTAGPGGGVRRMLTDVGRGAGLAAVVGIPGLGLYLGARALGLNTTVAAANLTDHWWTVPVLVLAAAQNAVLEEVVMVGYLFTRWREAGWGTAAILVVSALIRGGYHLYQGFGGGVGNVAMGLIFGFAYLRWRRVGPLIVAHTLLDVVAFVGYTLLKGYLGWL